ncbi:MAG: hypothetical protein K8L99_03175 [Anaerolineae bacterium]|nr:hypothetical protein [Anaerolineae bacterium]
MMTLLMIGLLLTACAQQAPTPEPEVTVEVTEELATAAPTATPMSLERPTLPPTWTPSPSAADDTSQQAEEATAAPIDNNEPAAPTEDPNAFIPPTALEACNSFGEDRTLNQRTFTPGAPVQVFWTPVEGAASYSVSLVNSTGSVLETEYTRETTYVFSPELFTENDLYGWEAYPIDPAGRQMCISRGAELVPDTLPQ